MAERKLAYIATISQLDKIPDKDRIVYASFKDLGWQVIVDVSNKLNDKVVYVEIDSILPVKPEYEFLRKRCFSEKWNGFIIRGMKMAGLVSMGLALPVPAGYEDKPDGFDMTDILEIRKKEDDVPDILPVQKSAFEKFINLICWKLGIKRKRKTVGTADGWLSFAHKTDETRIENLSYLFSDEFKGTPVYTTVKMDGQSATFAVYKKNFFIASRNVILYREPLRKAIRDLTPKRERSGMDNFIKIAARYDLPAKLSRFPTNDPGGVVVQGELCGPGIQKNPMGMAEIDLFVFNVYYPAAEYRKEKFLSWRSLDLFCRLNGLKTVPFIECRKFDWPDKAALKEYAKGKYPNDKDREGVVIRYDSGNEPMPEALRGMSNMWSFKCINDDYILGK
jgi:RNA ligase (TIGR02306 family)